MTTNLILMQAAAAGGGWETIIMIVALFAIFYFLMIRPQQKKQKEIQKYRAGVQKGDKVVTAGGIFGTVRQVKENSFMIEIDKNVCIEVDKGSIYPAPANGNQASAEKQ